MKLKSSQRFCSFPVWRFLNGLRRRERFCDSSQCVKLCRFRHNKLCVKLFSKLCEIRFCGIEFCGG